MRAPKSRTVLATAVGMCLLLPLSAAAQSDETDASPAPDAPIAGASPVLLPEFEGLAWHRSIDLTGPEMESELSPDEVADWGVMLDNADASFDQLEYTYQAVFDPSQLPDLGGLATVRVAGADEAVVLAAVVQDIIDQVVGLGADTPTTSEATISERQVTVVDLPESVGVADATVYVSGDTAYVLLLPEPLVADALAQLP
jgi:hypothetical protein